MAGAAHELNVSGLGEQRSVVGRIAAKGLADELRDIGYLVVDGVDGRAHYVRLPAQSDLGDLPVGGIVSVRPRQPSMADQNIQAHARNGIYRAADHMAAIKGRDRSPTDIVQAHVRRLEALRRADIVERIADGVWRVPGDLAERGAAFDHRRTGGVTIALRSHLSLAQQTQSEGATWLDEQLIAGSKDLAAVGFGAQARTAMEKRLEHLEEKGLAQRRGQRVVLARNRLRTLRARELAVAGQRLQAETGLTYHPVGDDGRASGIYRRSVVLASGRYAMLDNGKGFSLVPWKPVIELRIGQAMSVSVVAGSAIWSFGQQRGIAL